MQTPEPFTPDESRALVRDACALVGGKMLGDRCRGPAPGKGRRNDSLVIFPASASPYGFAVHLHNAPGDTQGALDVKRDLAARMGLEPRTARHGGSSARCHRPAARRSTATTDDAAQAAQRKADKRERDLKRCEAIWTATSPTGAPLEAYLKSGRGLRDPWRACALWESVRFHPALDYWQAGDDGRPVRLFTSPAMVARVVNADGRMTGLHLTYLTECGRKHPDAHPARKMRGSVKGGHVRLGDTPPDGRRAVAEGIETALAFTALWGIPCDAALSAGELARYTPPPECSALVIAADNDAATYTATGRNPGLDAARELAARMKEAGVPTRTMPPPRGCDWNDFLVGRV